MCSIVRTSAPLTMRRPRAAAESRSSGRCCSPGSALRQAGRVSPAILGVSLGTGLLAIVCWIDDLRGLSPVTRLAAQTVAVAIGLYVLPAPTTCSGPGSARWSISSRPEFFGSGGSTCSTSWTGSTDSPAARRRRSAAGYCFSLASAAGSIRQWHCSPPRSSARRSAFSYGTGRRRGFFSAMSAASRSAI